MDLEDAIESIFPLDTEHLILTWNNILIPLNYKYDISLMVLDFVRILHFLREEEDDKLAIHWASSTFASIWQMKKEDNFISIKSYWNTVNGGRENLLNEFNENKVSIKYLENEIKKSYNF